MTDLHPADRRPHPHRAQQLRTLTQLTMLRTLAATLADTALDVAKEGTVTDPTMAYTIAAIADAALAARDSCDEAVTTILRDLA